MKMNRVKGYLKRFVILGLMVSMFAGLTGCKLAKEEAEEATIINDKLAGCYITTEPIGNGKIYAKLVEVKEDDAEYSHYEYHFEGIEGIELYATTIMDRVGGNDYDIASYADEVCDRKTVMGNGYEEVGGTLYYTGGETIFYMNPVYQEKDGDVYMIKADWGQHTNGQGDMTQTISSDVTYWEGTVGDKQGSKVTVKYSSKQEPDKIKFIYMDADSKILQEDEYKPGEVPDEVDIVAGTEYVLVESYGYDAVEEMDMVERKTYGELDGYISTFMTNGKGYCIEKSTFVNWE